jgi:protein-tyrosine-phosphatase
LPPSNQPPEFLKVIANDVRWQLLSALGQSDYQVHELVSLLQQPQNLVSYHLKHLRTLHLVNERRSSADARDIYYSLDLDQLRTMYHAAGAALHPALVADWPLGEIRQTSLDGQPLQVLFLCTRNSARSQLAEGILRQLGGDQFAVFSAGTEPATVHPLALKLLADRHIDASQQRSKHVDTFKTQSFDYVITVCDRAREDCHELPKNTHQIHWSLPDPVAVEDKTPGDGAQYRAFEQTAQQLVTRIRYLLVSIPR